jgi:hypothetical protein
MQILNYKELFHTQNTHEVFNYKEIKLPSKMLSLDSRNIIENNYSLFLLNNLIYDYLF